MRGQNSHHPEFQPLIQGQRRPLSSNQVHVQVGAVTSIGRALRLQTLQNGVRIFQRQPQAKGVGIRFFSSLPDHADLGLPALSPTMTAGNIAKWNVKVGDKVAPGDLLCEIETDKATIGWESQEEGYVAKILVEDGAADVPVGKVVLVLCDNEGDVAALASYVPKNEAAAASPAAEAPKPAAAAATPAPAAPSAPAAPKAPSAPAPKVGGSFVEAAKAKQWAFSKEYGLPTPQHQYK
eukprot:CAMPEP_0184323776 /NCGR_PEP_ID=MMETSP1049-20130417/132013_1 /TAXON_ID=77928 /ORGANISM="Proteomonas sulcata, Strain CCMP704" /LENGTH=236 /DNA_ID=CAMNT_0026645361 /DNA_START=258 /DNA_END=968 /DNA_ORIENTATION=+